MATRRTAHTLLSIVTVWSVLATASRAAADWPRDVVLDEGVLTFHQPQLETFKAGRITARSAVRGIPRPTAEMIEQGLEPTVVYGTVWFEASLSTDRDRRVVDLVGVRLVDARFADSDDASTHRFQRAIETVISGRGVAMSLDRLLPMLELVEMTPRGGGTLDTSPPRVVFREHPTVLVTVDGFPQLRRIEQSNMLRVVNTPFFIVFDPSRNAWFMLGGDEWLIAPDFMGPWSRTDNTPPKVVALVGEADATRVAQARPTTRTFEVVMATSPTAVIWTNGDPAYEPLEGTSLRYLANTDCDVFLEVESQRLYAQLAGRWYSARRADGPWRFVPAERLPSEFRRIPADGPKGHVRPFVAGTREAMEAVLDTRLPQTAVIDRGASVVVTWDGPPRFEPIEGSVLEWGVNTPQAVLRLEELYLCCDRGVWFGADDPLGPWSVSEWVPAEIDTIPPSCPLYFAVFVDVYEATDDSVRVGYTQGYLGCYESDGAIVYGTGYEHAGWYDQIYVARPSTWGVGAVYAPFSGDWGFRVGEGGPGGWLGAGHLRSAYGGLDLVDCGWWGPGGYREVGDDPLIEGRRGDVISQSIDAERDWNVNRGVESMFFIDREIGDLYTRRDAAERRGGAMQAPTQRFLDDSGGAAGDGGDGRQEFGGGDPAPPSGRPEFDGGPAPDVVVVGGPEDLYADRDGRVYRATSAGWEQWVTRRWQSGSLADELRSMLDRSRVARERGTVRTLAFREERLARELERTDDDAGGARSR